MVKKVIVEKSRAASKVAVTFEEDDLTFLRKRAKAEEVSLSSIIRGIVSNHVTRSKAAQIGAKTRRSVL